MTLYQFWTQTCRRPTLPTPMHMPLTHLRHARPTLGTMKGKRPASFSACDSCRGRHPSLRLCGSHDDSTSRPAPRYTLHALIAAAASLTSRDAWSAAAECAHLLLYHAPQLLLRLPTPSTTCPPDLSDQNSTFAAQLKVRLRLTRASDWNALVDAYAADLQASLSTARRPHRHHAEGVDAHKAQAAAVRARVGALRSAADILVGGPPVPPTPAVTALIRDQFITAPRTADQDQHLAEAFAAARALAPKAKCRPRLRDVGHQVARSKAAAGPGPSGWRNSHIACTYAHAAGPPALLAWATLWAQGDVPPWAAALWSGALARPFWKTPEQRTVRPIMCTEALVKFSFGIVATAARAQIDTAVGPSQYGAGRAGGAEVEIAEIRAAVAHMPEKTLVRLDVKNAFGSIHWHQALLVLLASAPKLAAPLACLWSNGYVDVFTANCVGSWDSSRIPGSLAQGNVEARLVFCLTMANALHRAYHDPAVTPLARATWWYWLYVDDCIFQAECSDLLPIFDAIFRALAYYNLAIQPRKCSAHLPAHADGAGHPCAILPFSGPGMGTRRLHHLRRRRSYDLGHRGLRQPRYPVAH